MSAYFFAEGAGMLQKALANGARLSTAFFLSPLDSPEDQAALQSARKAGVECHIVSRGVFSRIYGLTYETAIRVLGVVEAQPLSQANALTRLQRRSCILVGEKIQDPRNIGVMVRTADACGAALAVFSEDSADAYSRACIRSTTGSIFRVPIVLPTDLSLFLKDIQAQGITLIGTSAHAKTACYDANLRRPCAVILGNESLGLSPALQNLCDVMTTIPMYGGADSFNVTVAAGILLYEINRQNDTL